MRYSVVILLGIVIAFTFTVAFEKYEPHIGKRLTNVVNKQ